MADKVKKTKAAAKPSKTATKATTAKPRKAAAKKEKVTEGFKPAMPSREQIEQLARSYWAARGYQDGCAEQDWLQAEQELLQMAS
ncbi:MAG: DUF2934 domain-containing protein [Terracidiphilus sp.]|jgi:hypothetical protein